MQEISEDVYRLDRAFVVVGDHNLTVIDPGDDSIEGNAIRRTPDSIVGMLENLANSTGKPPKYVVITHSHMDHWLNLQAIRQIWGDTVAIMHKNCRVPHPKRVVCSDRHRINIDGFTYTLISTEGHAQAKDDISLYLEDKRLMFVGDLCQPHGSGYHHHSDSFTCVPFYNDGVGYLQSLDRALGFDFDLMLTGHGGVYDKEHGIDALRITKDVIERTRDLSRKLVKENPGIGWAKICEWVFRTIAYERGMQQGTVDHRLSCDVMSGYVSCDRPGIRYWVLNAQQNLN